MKIKLEAASSNEYVKHLTDGKGHYISVYRDKDGELYAEGDVPARGYTVKWDNEMAEHCEIDLGFQEITNLNPANINLDEYEYCSHANGRDAHWQLYRKIVDGKGKWVARHDKTGEIREISCDQARGFEPIDDSPIRRLSRDLGGMIMPKRESTDIEDDQYFAREDLHNLAEEIEYILVNNFDTDADVTEYYITNGVLEVTASYADCEYDYKEKIDMRKIRKSSDLMSTYAHTVATELFRQIERDKVVSESENTQNGVYWYGKYTDMKGKEKKIIVKIPAKDYDEADKEFEASIPEPYTKYKLWGHFTRKDSYTGKQLPKEGYVYLEESVTEARQGRFPGLSDARATIDRYSKAQVRFVQMAFNDYIRAVNRGFEEQKPSNSAQIKNEWIAEAEMDELMTSAEFNELWNAVKVVEEVNAHESIAIEAASKSSQVSSMTRKGTRIPNPEWSQFAVGTYVQVTTPQNPALDLKVGSKAGRIVGKVKDTYVYSSDNSTGRMGRDNDFKNELDTSAPQSCLVEVHDDYKIKQHGESTNRIIIPVEWLREVDEKTYKDSINAIPRKGFDKMINRNKKRIESLEPTSTNLDWLVVAKSIDATPDKGNEAEFKRVVASFSTLVHAEDFIKNCLPKGREDAFEIISKSGGVIEENNSTMKESRDRKKFNFKCRKCGNEFVDEYDYPLPTDCNACVYCPECNGVACVQGKEPIAE